MRPILTESEVTNLDRVLHARAADSGTVRSFLSDCAGRSGLTASRYPGLFAAIANGPTPAAPRVQARSMPVPQAPLTSFRDGVHTNFFGTDPATGKVLAEVTVTMTKPVDFTTVWLNVVGRRANGDTVVFASSVTQSFANNTTVARTDLRSALPPEDKVDLFLTTSYVVIFKDGSVTSNTATNSWAHEAASDPIVEAPAIRKDRTKGDLSCIMVGLSRGFGSGSPKNNTDVDYWFWQNQYSNTTLLVPLKGKIQFRRKLAALSDTNPVLEFYLAKAEGGMAELKDKDTIPYRKYFTLDPSDPKGRTLLFDLSPTATTAGNAINFGPSIWNADTKTFFTARISVVFAEAAADGGNTGWATILSSLDDDTDAADGVATIKPIRYVWHCLAAGTRITLADGSTRPVEDIVAGDTVLSANGPRAVMATLAQPHHGPVITLGFTNGASLTGSATHPVRTPDGMVQAAALAVGDTVLTASGGRTTVATVGMGRMNGEGLFNLWLDPDDEGETTMIANGIVTGDYQTQLTLLDKAATDPALIRARLPPSLHTDFDSWLEDVRAG